MIESLNTASLQRLSAELAAGRLETLLRIGQTVQAQVLTVTPETGAKPMLAGTLSGVEMGLDLAGVPFSKGGVSAALEYLVGASKGRS